MNSGIVHVDTNRLVKIIQVKLEFSVRCLIMHVLCFDGICVKSGKKYALLLPEEISDNLQENLAILLNRANISKNESLTETSFFKFKNTIHL